MADVLTQSLVAVLQGTALQSQVAFQLEQIRLEHMARLLQQNVAALEDAKWRQACQLILGELTEETTLALLRAPALCQTVRAGLQPATLACLLMVARAESDHDEMQAWSLLGDAWLGGDAPSQHRQLSKTGGRYRAPRLACDVAIDLSLDARLAHPSAGLQQPFALTGEDLDKAVLRLDAALAMVASTFPLGYEIFSTLAGNVVVRGDNARPTVCWGATSGLAIGRVVVVNCLNKTDLRMVAAVLLHESVHCALDCAELARPLWRPRSAADSASFDSPWTGNPMTPHALVHACVVWAVLLEHWIACDRQWPADSLSRTQRDFIVRGFERLQTQEAARQVLLSEALTPAAADVMHVASRFAVSG